jgi:hypothetical protein
MLSIKLPPSNGLGRSIQVDLSTYAKGKIDAVVRELKLEQTNAPLGIIYPVEYNHNDSHIFTNFGITLIHQ